MLYVTLYTSIGINKFLYFNIEYRFVVGCIGTVYSILYNINLY